MGLIFEFFGGPRDGEVRQAGRRCPQSDEIQRRCAQHDPAVIGERIHCSTLYAETVWETCSDSAIQDFLHLGMRFPNHTYEVVSRQIAGPDIRLGLKHMGAAAGGPECRSCPLRDASSPNQ